MALDIERIGTNRAVQPMGALAATHVLRDHELSSEWGWELNPPFQRGAVWTLAQKRRWIESILMGVGLPAIIVNRFHDVPHPNYGWSDIVIDGQQRLRATAEFISDKFQVYGEKFSEQSEVFHRRFLMSDGLVPVIYCGYKTDAECAQLYLKLLSAGTAHTPEEIAKAKKFIKESL